MRTYATIKYMLLSINKSILFIAAVIFFSSSNTYNSFICAESNSNDTLMGCLSKLASSSCTEDLLNHDARFSRQELGDAIKMPLRTDKFIKKTRV